MMWPIHRLPPADPVVTSSAPVVVLANWKSKHAEHHRQWLDVVIGIWAHWRCTCGDRAVVAAEQRSDA